MSAIVHRLEQLASRGFSGEGLSVQLVTGEEVRRILAQPYLIYYRIGPASLFVVRIRHSARRPIER